MARDNFLMVFSFLRCIKVDITKNIAGDKPKTRTYAEKFDLIQDTLSMLMLFEKEKVNIGKVMQDSLKIRSEESPEEKSKYKNIDLFQKLTIFGYGVDFFSEIYTKCLEETLIDDIKLAEGLDCNEIIHLIKVLKLKDITFDTDFLAIFIIILKKLNDNEAIYFLKILER